ncbi:hypothetical protein I6F21_06320 [Bradyrhizobium sp. NBAIM03]|uniref:class I SAM-dependent methyltransferase n=1 Tax=Bradyrhizobium sp. NBAIM03 TaxID=2793816 RepID=UPI001CD6535B|nr:class I SAM-dependent methyltransferase [Bradyrhizobium sp. NBAIM03]MCA1532174.1 hypothetical protein [Bradyrhizobium sp. NBAIM03]
MPTDAEFDLIVSIGVIHHIPAPNPIVQLRCERPGGRMIVWLYGEEGSGLIVQSIRALRAVTTRLPHVMVAAIASLLTLALDVYIFGCRYV